MENAHLNLTHHDEIMWIVCEVQKKERDFNVMCIMCKWMQTLKAEQKRTLDVISCLSFFVGKYFALQIRQQTERMLRSSERASARCWWSSSSSTVAKGNSICMLCVLWCDHPTGITIIIIIILIMLGRRSSMKSIHNVSLTHQNRVSLSFCMHNSRVMV